MVWASLPNLENMGQIYATKNNIGASLHLLPTYTCVKINTEHAFSKRKKHLYTVVLKSITLTAYFHLLKFKVMQQRTLAKDSNSKETITKDVKENSALTMHSLFLYTRNT